MCGLSGCLVASGYPEDLRRSVTAMTQPLRHRGPDDEGLWIDAQAGIGLGHRRLSIIDLSREGHQPMVSASDRYVIALNGEIYNFRELRRQLDAPAPPAGSVESPIRQHWRGHSDTEVLLAAIERWGLDGTLRKVVGMFAFALWDRAESTLHLARDRLGEKPLYYGWQGNSFLFGSELKALKAHPDFRAPIDRDALTLFLRHGYVPAPYSIHAGIHKLTPGTHLSVSRNLRDAKPRQYWSAREEVERAQQSAFRGGEGEALERLEELIRQSLAGQMVADVPLGAFLSGGIDSSIVVSLMQQISPRPVRTFSIGFLEQGFDEANHARAVARHLGTEHTELYARPEDARAVIPRLPALYDEPFADSSQIPTFLLSTLAREHVTVTLSGDGGDELFGGYNRYSWVDRIWRGTGWAPRSLRVAVGKVLMKRSPDAWNRAFAIMLPVIPAASRFPDAGQKLHKLALSLSANSPEEIYLNLASQWMQPEKIVLQGREPVTAASDFAGWARLGDITHRMMYADLVSYLPDDILVKIDRAAMGASLETRVPLLDHRLVEFAWRLPLAMKIRHGQGKWILRRLLRKFVPEELTTRPKMGFGVPIGDWLRGPLRQWADALLDESRLRREGYFNPAPILRKWSEHLSGKRDWQYHLWNVLMFQAWYEHQRD